MNLDLIKAMIARRAKENRDKSAEISQHDGNWETGNACDLYAQCLENLLRDIDNYDKAAPETPSAKVETPKHSITWEQWQRNVTDQLIEQLEISNSDAQAIVEAKHKLVIQLWYSTHTPAQAATVIDRQSAVTVGDLGTYQAKDI